MAQVNVELEKGTITYNTDELDLKQDFFVKSFDQMSSVLEGMIELMQFSKSVYEGLSATAKSKMDKVPDFDALTKDLVDMATRHKEYSDQVKALQSEKEKNITPAKQMTAEQLQKQMEKRLREAEKKEQKALS